MRWFNNSGGKTRCDRDTVRKVSIRLEALDRRLDEIEEMDRNITEDLNNTTDDNHCTLDKK